MLLQVLALLFAGLAATPPALAAGNALLPGAVGCRGKDMVAELKAAEPDLAEKIARESKATANADALLWRIETPGVAPSYLFGTVHLADPRVTYLPETVATALREAKAVAVEVADLSADGAAGAMAAAGRLAVFTGGRSLASLLSPEDYAKVETTLERSGIPAAAGRLMKPWIVSLLLATSECERRKVGDGEPVLDQKIAAEALALSIPLIGLETAEGQLAALAAVPEHDQLDMLRAGLAYADRSDDLMETMVVLYASRRLGELWPFQIALASKAGVPEASFMSFKDLIVARRNRLMRDGARPLIDKGGAFVAVGALHLVGEDGLVALFREAGYTVSKAE